MDDIVSKLRYATHEIIIGDAIEVVHEIIIGDDIELAKPAQKQKVVAIVSEISEAEFQKAVITLAKLHNWRVMHTQPAQIRPGKWITPNTGNQGFPDLVMSHPYRGTIFVELKTNKGIVSENQWDWINSLQDSGEEVHVWRPCHLEKISERLAKDANND